MDTSHKTSYKDNNAFSIEFQDSLPAGLYLAATNFKANSLLSRNNQTKSDCKFTVGTWIQ